jgi:hypothetical protein
MGPIRRSDVSTAAIVLGVVLILVAGFVGYALTGGSFFPSNASTKAETTITTSRSSFTSYQPTTSTTTNGGQSTYGGETISLGWSYRGVYSGQNDPYLGRGDNATSATSFTLVVGNLGNDSIIQLSYELQGGIGPITGAVPLAPKSTETIQDAILTSCNDSYLSYCPQTTLLRVNVGFAGGEAFSIPRYIGIDYISTLSLTQSNTQSAYCSKLLSTVSASDVHASFVNHNLSLVNRGNSTLGLAAYLIFDPLNAHGLRLFDTLGIDLPPSGSGSTEVFIGSPNFILGKTYTLWLQLGQPNVDDNPMYAPDGTFCTFSLPFTP